MTNLENVLKKQRYHFADKGQYGQDYGFSSSHLRLWEQDHKEGRVLKNRCFQTVVLEKTLESPLDSKESKPVNLKGNQPWILIGKIDPEAEALICFPLDANSWFIGKPWCWERLKAQGEGGNRGWDGWMTSPMQWTWTWANSRRWWGTESLVCDIHRVSKSWKWLGYWTITR